MTTPLQPIRRLIPWVRQGNAQLAGTTDTLGAGVPSTIAVTVKSAVNATHPIELAVSVYGPGDVIGLDRKQVVRLEPRPLTGDFAANYFPLVEFDRPDLPWLMTPAQPDAQGRLRPWIVLVVVEKQAGVALAMDGARPLPVLTIADPARADRELPDLDESWAWAHAQVTGRASPTETIAQALADDPARTISRLVCPRRLKPRTHYLAAVVPAFAAGRKVGLGLPLDASDATLAPAWAGEREVTLPVYFHWEFSTGDDADFEELVRRLAPRVMPREVGVQPIDVGAAGPGLPDGGTIELIGALRAPRTEAAAWPGAAAFGAGLRAIVDAPERLRADDDADPIVAPPRYGRWHAAATSTPATGWVGELNGDPRHRAIAALGTRAVQDQQEALMASAWQQIGDVLAANRVLAQAQLARAVGTRLHGKQVKKAPAEALLLLTAPVHATLLDHGHSFRASLAASRITAGAVSAPARRALANGGVLAKRVSARAATAAAAATVATASTAAAMVKRLNATAEVASAPAPAGMVTLDAVAAAVGRATVRFAALTADAIRAQPVRAAPERVTPERVTPERVTPERVTPERLPPRRPTPAGPREREVDPRPDPVRPVRPTRDAAIALREAARFRDAAAAALADVVLTPDLVAAPPPLAIDLARNFLIAELDPERTIPRRALARLDLAAVVRRPDRDPLDAVMAAPSFPQPVAALAGALAPELFFPGLAKVPPDTATLLATNPAFVEAFLVGMNHEMARELLWREYPTDQRGSYFRQFWDVRGRVPAPATEAERAALLDVEPLHRWPVATALGRHAPVGARTAGLVLLIRGELLRRYPTALVYAVRGAAGPGGRTLGSEERWPLFRGSLEPDVTYLGFELTEDEARADPGWFFVIQEQPTEPRFGLDVARQGGRPAATSWNDLSWGHLAADDAALAALTHVRVRGPLPDTSHLAGPVVWGRNAAHQAQATLQVPVRIAIHGSQMLKRDTP